MENRGLVHLYHGDGKGKTTAAMGLALRAVAAGRRVLIVQFFKNGLSGEVRMLKNMPGVNVLAGTTSGRFFWEMDDAEKAATRELHDSHVTRAAALVESGEADFLILDELLSAWNQDMVDQDKVLELIDQRPQLTEVCITGRGPAEALLERADYITNMKLERHPFEQGISARMGIEF